MTFEQLDRVMHSIPGTGPRRATQEFWDLRKAYPREFNHLGIEVYREPFTVGGWLVHFHGLNAATWLITAVWPHAPSRDGSITWANKIIPAMKEPPLPKLPRVLWELAATNSVPFQNAIFQALAHPALASGVATPAANVVVASLTMGASDR